MESSSVSTETFKALTLQNDTIFSVSKLMRDFLKVGGTRAKFAMLCTILSALFVLLVPTWLSAMTGYTADIEGFVQDSNNNLAPAGDFRPAIYTIHDGDRIGLTKDYHVAVPWYVGQIHLFTYKDYGCSLEYRTNYTTGEHYWAESSDASCTMLWRVSEYTSIYGFLGLNATETEFTLPNTTNITIPEPSLNISAHFPVDPDYLSLGPGSRADIPWYQEPYGLGWKRNDTNEFPFFTKSDPLFYHQLSDTLYNLTQFNSNGGCQQLRDVRYKWGFSFLLLYAFVVTWLVWTIVMYGLYLDSYLHSRLDVVRRNMGLDRAVLDLSLAMQKEVDSQNVQLHGDRQLHHLFKSGCMSYQDLPLGTLPPTRWTQLQKRWRELKSHGWTQLPRWWRMPIS